MNQWFGLGIALELRDNLSRGLATAQSTFERFRNSTQRGVQDIKTQIDALNSLQLGGAFLSENGEMIKGLGTSLLNPVVDLGKKVISTSSQFEQWRMTLKALYKDADVANEKLAWGLKLAASTPFDMADVTQALIGFKAVGAESDTVFKNANGEARTFLEYMGDLAALRPDVGLDGVLMGVRNLLGGDGGRSLTMRMDIDLENILGREFGDTTDQIMQDLVEASDKLAGGLMKELEGTWGHLTGNLQDQAERLFLAIGDNGAFDMFKDALRGFSNIIDDIDDEKMAKIGTNIARAFKLIWSPLNLVIKGLQTVFKWIIKLAESNSVFSSLVLGVTTFVGSVLALSGVMLTFGGGLIQTISSLGLFLLMLQNSPNKFTGILNAFKTLASKVLPMIALMGALALAWRTDFMGVKTTMTNFTNTLKTSWSEAKRISSLGVNDMLAELSKLDTTTFGGWLTYNLVRLMVLWEALCECWNTNELSDETFQKVQALGLLPLLSAILDLKQRATSFFKGFKEGWENVSNVVSKVVGFIGEKIGELIAWLFPVKDETDKVSDSVGGIDISKWEKFGEVTAYIVSLLGGLKILSKIIKGVSKVTKTVTSVVKGLTKIAKGAKTVVKVLGTAIKGVGKFFGVIGGLVIQLLGAFGIVVTLPAWLVGVITVAVIAVIALAIKYRDKIWEGLKTLGGWIKDGISGLVQIVVGIVASIVLAITGIIMTIAVIVETVIGIIITIIGTIVGVVTTIVLVVVGLFQAGFQLISGVVSTVVTIITTILAGIMGVVSTIIAFITGVFQTGFAVIQAVVQTFCAIAKAIFTGDFSSLAETLKGIWSNLGSKIQEIWDNVTNAVSEIWDKVGSFISDAWDKLGEKWTSITDNIKEIASNTIENIKEVWGGITDFFSGLWDGIMESASSMFSWLADKFTWVTDSIGAVKDFFNGDGDGKSKKSDKKKDKGKSKGKGKGKGKDMVGLSTGGFVKTEGIAVLHPNEVVVNDDLTKRLRSFLTSNENSTNTSARMLTPVINLEQSTPNITVNIPNLDSKVIPIDLLRTKREGQPINNTTNVQDILNSSSNYYNSESLTNNYDNTRSLVNNRVSNLNTLMNNYDDRNFGDNITTNKNDHNTNSIVNDNLYKTTTNNSNVNNTNNTTTGNVDNSVTFSEGAIQIQLQQGSEADANKLAKMIMDKIKKEMQLRNTLNYKAN